MVVVHHTQTDWFVKPLCFDAFVFSVCIIPICYYIIVVTILKE